MAKKQEPKEDKVNYNEVHNTKIEDLAGGELEIKDEVIDEAIKEDKTKVEEKAEEIVEDKTKGKEEVDVEALEERISAKVQKETVEKITKALTGEEAKEEEVSEYKKFANETWKKEGRNPTYEEALEFVSERAMTRLEEKHAAKLKEEEDKVEQSKKATQEREEQINKYIDSELDDLISNNKIPKIVNKDDENDPGVKARKAIFQAMLEINTERAKQGKDPIYSPKIVYYEHYKDPNQQPAGYDAPISRGRDGVHTENDGKVNYKEIHNKSFIDMMLGR